MKIALYIVLFSVMTVALVACNGGGDSTSNNPYQAPPPTGSTNPPPPPPPAGFSVQSISPANGTTGVSPDGSIIVNFSSDIDPASIFYNSGLPGGTDDVKLFVTNSTEQQEVAITVTPSEGTSSRQMVIKPMVSLVPNTHYTLELTSDLHDTGGTTLAKNESISFSTSPNKGTDATKTVINFLVAKDTMDITHIIAYWDTAFHGRPSMQNGAMQLVPADSEVYPQSEILVTSPSTPILAGTPQAVYTAVLPNSFFPKGQTIYLTLRNWSGNARSTYSNEVGTTIP